MEHSMIWHACDIVSSVATMYLLWRISQALSELNSEGQNIPFLVQKEENPAQSK